MRMRGLRFLGTTVLISGSLWAQTSADPNAWSFYANIYAYIAPHNEFYASPTLLADHKWLHLEARYNYENQRTGSVWAGYNFHAGDKLVFEFTPMAGAVFGRTVGFAPGYQGLLTYGKVELNSQGEYVFDTRDRSGSFFYTWSELNYSLMEWLRVGFVVERTKAYKSPFETQPGCLIGFTFKRTDFTTYVFNPGRSDPSVVLAVGVRF
jgi:hypothetical protein